MLGGDLMEAKKAVREGDYGDVVVAVQRLLNEVGFSVEETAKFDAQTQLAVSQFQKTTGLSVTGCVDTATYKALRAARELRAANKATSAVMQEAASSKSGLTKRKSRKETMPEPSNMVASEFQPRSEIPVKAPPTTKAKQETQSFEPPSVAPPAESELAPEDALTLPDDVIFIEEPQKAEKPWSSLLRFAVFVGAVGVIGWLFSQGHLGSPISDDVEEGPDEE